MAKFSKAEARVEMRMPAMDLAAKYGFWGSHPLFPVNYWIHEVNSDYTRLGYWEWVQSNLWKVEEEEDE